MAVFFHLEQTGFKLAERNRLKAWLHAVAKQKGKSRIELHFVFVGNEEILRLNREYLKHDYYTDIITFDNSVSADKIEGDIFISIDCVRDNSQRFKAKEEEEFRRVMVHGLLHLLGYSDKKKKEQELMREEEAKALRLFLRMRKP